MGSNTRYVPNGDANVAYRTIGECEVRGDDIGGIAVHIGSRVCHLAGASEVPVSGTLRDLVVGSGLQFEDRGGHELEGVPGEWRMFAVQSSGGTLVT